MQPVEIYFSLAKQTKNHNSQSPENQILNGLLGAGLVLQIRIVNRNAVITSS